MESSDVRERAYVLSIASIVVAAFMVVQPVQLNNLSSAILSSSSSSSTNAYAQVESQALPSFNNCDDHMVVGTSMNTVIGQDIALTEHKEKEIFECYLTQGNIEVIVEVTITAQLYQDTVTRSIMKKTADVVTCVRLPDRATVLGCKAEKPSTDPIHVQKCIADRIFRDMNTANKGNLVKNVEAQKIVYLCDLDGFDKDVNGLPVTCNNN